MRTRNTLLLFINGEHHELGADQAGMMLADYLRYQRQLTGTKIVCAEGDCGACTVLRFFPGVGKKSLGRTPSFLPLNSCITTMAQLDGSSIVTVEALGNHSRPNPVQEAMKSCHGSQCGFCTPGFVMALAGLAERKLACGDKTEIGRKEAQNTLTGNLCRCTGYQQIVDAAVAVDLKKYESLQSLISKTQHKRLKAALALPLELTGENYHFFAPTNLKSATTFLSRAKDFRILASGTDLGVVHNKGKIRLDKLLSLHLIPKLYELSVSKKGLTKVGARVTLTELRHALKETSPEFARFLDLFASPQIKNIATLVGNVANASPIADTPPFLLTCDALVRIAGPKGNRAVPLENFYLGYRKTALRRGEIVVSLEFQTPSPGEKVALYKISERKDLDISCLNAGFRLAINKKGVIESARLAIGGVAATPLRLYRTEKTLIGLQPDAGLLARASAALQEEINPLSDLRGSSAYRRVQAGNLLKRFFHEQLGIQA